MNKHTPPTAPQATPVASLQRLADLLRLEMDYERHAHARTLAPGRIAATISQPDCRYPITLGQSSYNALDQLLLTVTYPLQPDDADTDFEPGKPVAFFHLDPSGNALRELPFQAYIEQAEPGALTLAMPTRAALQSLRAHASSRLLGLCLSVDTTSYRVMLDALALACRSTDPRFLTLRDTLIGPLQPTFRSLPPLSLPWLNPGQQHAVQRVVEAQQVAIVHGPPGTGKTTTLVEAVIETLQRETQVLVCAPSNAAVDWISLQLAQRGVPLLRIGNPLRMTDQMLECSYERRYAAHPHYAELWAIRRALRQAPAAEGRARQQQQRLAHLRDRATQLEITIQRDLFDHARVIACTLIGSAYRLLDHRRFTTLFIDEAAQALEPACWAAILKADRVILSGDHCQLPPTVRCPDAARQGLALTLMQRLAQTKPACVTLLQVQYRMNSAIMQFPSRWFYHGRLAAAPEVASRLVSPIDTPITWLDTSQCHFGERQGLSPSRSNSEEARLLVHALRRYTDTIGIGRLLDQRTDFGIISPYRAQVRLIRRLLKWQKYFRTLRPQITVGTVDGFQGQERDVIVISMVRDNEQGSIGFLRDLRRMNVAITRARMKLIILGNADTLGRHPFYAQFVEHVKQVGEFVELRVES
ncbi:MAG: AAA family ATPase [Bacteroidales bacterium]|nr:AAA family ATPase [Bacteroidales bacterium]